MLEQVGMYCGVPSFNNSAGFDIEVFREYESIC